MESLLFPRQRGHTRSQVLCAPFTARPQRPPLPIRRPLQPREVHEAQNLAKITTELLDAVDRQLTISTLLARHRNLLSNIRDDWAGRFRQGKEWVRVGGHIGANPDFTSGFVAELISKYNADTTSYFLDKIAWSKPNGSQFQPFANERNG